jgi:hypothetical protein
MGRHNKYQTIAMIGARRAGVMLMIEHRNRILLLPLGIRERDGEGEAGLGQISNRGTTSA